MSSDGAASRRFALATAGLSAGFGVPIALAPHKWARAFGWPDVPETDESRYFGRALGGLALAAAASSLVAAKDPEKSRSHFLMVEGVGWLLAAVHLKGALERLQPTSETLEIPGWAALGVCARKFAPPRSSRRRGGIAGLRAKDHSASRRFALVFAGVGTGFGVPILLAPHKWARSFGWPDVPETDESRYFGRCLGAFAIASAAAALMAAREPDGNRSQFRFIEAVGWLGTAVHVLGALERSQPVSETLEIPGWAALGIAARRFAP